MKWCNIYIVIVAHNHVFIPIFTTYTTIPYSVSPRNRSALPIWNTLLCDFLGYLLEVNGWWIERLIWCNRISRLRGDIPSFQPKIDPELAADCLYSELGRRSEVSTSLFPATFLLFFLFLTYSQVSTTPRHFSINSCVSISSLLSLMGHT
jgi:hypothetical protein